MLEKLPPEAAQLLAGLAGLIPTASLARLLLHHQLVRAGRRRFWSAELLWEGPTAVFCAVIGGGVSAYFALGPEATHAVVGTCGWFGPRGMEILLGRWLARYSNQKTEDASNAGS